MTHKPVLAIERLTKRYRPTGPTVFENIDFELQPREYVAIIGESGVGKSTLLNVIAGLDRPDAGSVRVDGIDLTQLGDDAVTLFRRRHMGFVFQAFHVLPYLTVLQNVALPLDLLGISGASRRTQALEMLRGVGLEQFAERYPRELSGGEMQRVGIARALVHRPRLVLADEPTGNLDGRTAAQILALLRERLRATGASGILITHSAVAVQTTDRALLLDGRGLRPLEAT